MGMFHVKHALTGAREPDGGLWAPRPMMRGSP